MRRLLLNVAPFRVYPPVSGVHHAVYYADEALSKYWNVFLFTTGVRKDTLRFPPRAEEFVINPHFREYSYVTASVLPLKYCIHSEYERVEAKKKFGLSDKKVVVFSVALYQPNVEAVRFIYQQNHHRRWGIVNMIDCMMDGKIPEDIACCV